MILSINQTPVPTPEAAATVVDAARRANRNTVLLQVRRGNGPARLCRGRAGPGRDRTGAPSGLRRDSNNPVGRYEGDRHE